MRRNRYEIAREILQLCKDPISKTSVVYQCNLNFKTINPHLDRLTHAGLLEASGGLRITYRTTATGLEALGHMNSLKNLIGDFS